MTGDASASLRAGTVRAFMLNADRLKVDDFSMEHMHGYDSNTLVRVQDLTVWRKQMQL